MKKLRRGLQDLSPLFQTTVQTGASPPAVPPAFDVQFLSVCVPDHEGDAFLANAFIASQMVRETPFYASLVSVVPGMNTVASKTHDVFPALEFLDPRICRLSLSHQELWSFTRNGRSNGSSQVSSADPAFPSFLVFLEFEPAQFRSLAQIALLLDRVVLFLKPDVESLREGYRMIKVLWNLNREIEFFLLFREQESLRSQEEFLYERFSLITSRFLGISSSWLGNLALPGKNKAGETRTEETLQFNPEALLSTEGLKRPLSPEKNRCWQALRQILGRRFQHEEAPPVK